MMKNKTDFDRLFAEAFVKEPNINNPIFCFHDSKGKILHIVNEEAAFPSMILKLSLLQDMDLSVNFPFEHFDCNLENNFLRQRYWPEKMVLSLGFFTSLPVTTLYSKKSDDDLFLGRLYYNNLLPNFSTPGVTGFILADMISGTLVGMNDHFFGLFKGRGITPGEMLNKPLGNFLSSTPKAHQESLQSHYTHPAKGLKKEFSVDSEEGLSLYDLQKTGLLEKVVGFPESYGTYTRFPVAVDTETEDFELTVKFLNFKGYGPALFLAAPEVIKPEWEIDYNGYMAGMDRTSGRPIIKKRGLVAARGEKTSDITAEHTFTLSKRGHCLLLYCDGKKTTGFFDREFIALSKAGIYMTARGNDAFLVKEMVLQKGKSERRPDDDNDFLVVDFVSTRTRSFLLEPFYNDVFAQARYLTVGGFLLTDISEFRSKAVRLENRLADEIREKETLKKKVRKYEDRDALACWGVSPVMDTVRRDAESIAETNATVLIEGETGTGKEVLARYIHRYSNRSDGPFVKVDCATVPVNLIESILFGHVKGAFTGAVSDNLGMLRSANHGTLFLDEAGNLTIDVQAKLLQFFNDLSVSPVGGTAVFKVDVRCIIASNRSLLSLVRDGKFREDLYYRINVISLHMPMLRERPEDLPFLCDVFIREYSRAHKKPVKSFSEEALDKLTQYGWPGNVRELRNIIQRAVIYSTGREIDAQDIRLPETVPLSSAPRSRKPRTPYSMAKTDPAVIEKALKEHLGIVKKAAASLNIDRGTLYKYLKKKNLSPDHFRGGLIV